MCCVVLRVEAQVEAGAAARKVETDKMGMYRTSAPGVSASATPTSGGAGGSGGAIVKSSGAAAASFTSTEMDVVTRFVPSVDTAADKAKARYEGLLAACSLAAVTCARLAIDDAEAAESRGVSVSFFDTHTRCPVPLIADCSLITLVGTIECAHLARRATCSWPRTLAT